MSSPILNYLPLGGVPIIIPGLPPATGLGGDITPLTNGQSYIQVVFDEVQPNASWEFIECIVVNTIDANPLNIWPGILTAKSATGFTLQLNGLPDSGNYFLHWSFTGVGGGNAVVVVVASTYTLSGPASGTISVPSTIFTVAIPGGSTLPVPVTVTPSAGGGGGTFTPASMILSTGSPSATFTYTPSAYGAKTISTTNSGALTDPASLTYTSLATTYTLTGPSSGAVSVASTNFTAALPVGGVVTGTITVTPNDSSGGGTFTPTSVALTTGAPSATFTYTPASTGAKTIATTNSGSLTNPSNLTYTVGSGALSDGDPVSTWLDSSGNGHNATMTGSARPIFKTGIVGGKPVVRFTTAGQSKLNFTPFTGATSYGIFAVMKATGPTVALYSISGGVGNGPWGPLENTTGDVYISDRVNLNHTTATNFTTAFHVFTGTSDGSGGLAIYVDGTNVGSGNSAFANTGDFSTIGYNLFGPIYSDGDLAEVIVYNSQLIVNRANIEKYLGTKFGITVAGGTAVDPSTVTGLVGWWKADSGVS